MRFLSPVRSVFAMMANINSGVIAGSTSSVPEREVFGESNVRHGSSDACSAAS